MHIKKTIRRALIALIALVLVAVALNYTQSWRRARVVMQAGKILGAELLRSAEGIEYSDNQNGVVRFKVRAKSLQETREGKNLLQGIEAFDFNPDGTVRNQIRSRNAEYDRDSKKAFFSGDVQVQMGEGVEIRTESLNYDLQSNVGHTNDRFRLISPQASGTAQGLRYDHANKTLELYSELDFILMRAVHKPDGSTQEEKVRVTARRGYYAQNERFMRFQGGSRVESESDILAGNNIEATFSADQKHIKSLLCQGSASYVSKDPSRSRELRGDRIQFGILPDTGALQRIDVMGQASFLSCSEDSEQELRASGIVLELDPVKGVPTKVLSQDNVRFNLKRNLERTQIAGDNLEAYFDAGTDSLKRVRVWDRAEMANRAGEAEGDELKAEEIRIAFQTVANRSALKELQAERAVKWRTPPRKKTETDGAETRRNRRSGAWKRTKYDFASIRGKTSSKISREKGTFRCSITAPRMRVLKLQRRSFVRPVRTCAQLSVHRTEPRSISHSGETSSIRTDRERLRRGEANILPRPRFWCFARRRKSRMTTARPREIGWNTTARTRC